MLTNDVKMTYLLHRRVEVSEEHFSRKVTPLVCEVLLGILGLVQSKLVASVLSPVEVDRARARLELMAKNRAAAMRKQRRRAAQQGSQPPRKEEEAAEHAFVQVAQSIRDSYAGGADLFEVTPSLLDESRRVVVETMLATWNLVATLSEQGGLRPPSLGEWFVIRYASKCAVLQCAGLLQKWLKWHFACAVSRSLRQVEDYHLELPKCPIDRVECPGKFFHGAGYRFLNQVYNTEEGVRQQMAHSLQQSKALFPRPDDWQVVEGEVKSFKTITQPRPRTQLSWAMDQSLRKVVDYVTSGRKPSLEGLQELPKNSASFLTNRKSGGARFELSELLQKKVPQFAHFGCRGDCPAERCSGVAGFSPENTPEVPVESHLGPREEYEEFKRCECVHCAAVHFLAPLPSPRSQMGLCGGCTILELEGVENCVREAQQSLYRANARPDVRIVGLREAFKVRTISAGPARTYYWARQLWHEVYKCVTSKPEFSLARGEDLDETVSSALHRRRAERFFPGEELFYLSGDYEAATDNLDPVVSERIAELLSQCLGWSQESLRVMKDCLTGHTVHLSPDVAETFDVAPFATQKWGQLMGSIVSFPVLCIANAATVVLAYRMTYKRWPILARLPFLVNGDDLGGLWPRPMIDNWMDSSSRFGLIPSIGKNFVHRNYMTINSQLFSDTYHHVDCRLVPQARGARLCRIRQVPWRCLFATGSRSIAAEKEDQKVHDENDYGLGGLDKQLDYCLSAFPYSSWERVREIFIDRRWQLLNDQFSGISWSVPCDYGGPGLHVPRLCEGREWWQECSLSSAWYAFSRYLCLRREVAPWVVSAELPHYTPAVKKDQLNDPIEVYRAELDRVLLPRGCRHKGLHDALAEDAQAIQRYNYFLLGKKEKVTSSKEDHRQLLSYAHALAAQQPHNPWYHPSMERWRGGAVLYVGRYLVDEEPARGCGSVPKFCELFGAMDG